MIQMNIRIDIWIKNIQIFEYLNIFATLWYVTIRMMRMTITTRMRMMNFLMVCCIVGPSGAPNSRISVTS